MSTSATAPSAARPSMAIVALVFGGIALALSAMLCFEMPPLFLGQIPVSVILAVAGFVWGAIAARRGVARPAALTGMLCAVLAIAAVGWVMKSRLANSTPAETAEDKARLKSVESMEIELDPGIKP